MRPSFFGSLKSNSCHRLFVHCSFLESKSKVCFWVRHFPSSDLLTCKIFHRIMSRKYARCAKPPPASWQDSADIAAHFVSNAPSSKFTTCLAATLTFLLLLDNSAHSRYQRSFTCLIILCPDFMPLSSSSTVISDWLLKQRLTMPRSALSLPLRLQARALLSRYLYYYTYY